MQNLKLYNTLSRKKEVFEPIKPPHVGMYVCGPTVYDDAHLGHAKSALVFDLLVRVLTANGYNVTYARNITDIDDKLIDQSIRENIPVKQIAEKYIKAFYQDCDALEIKPANHHPHATEFISEMVELIHKLEEIDMAYEVNGDVYFDVSKAKGYGKLSGKKLEDLQAGARVQANIQKRNPSDFTLWKTSKPGEPFWESPWGK